MMPCAAGAPVSLHACVRSALLWLILGAGVASANGENVQAPMVPSVCDDSVLVIPLRSNADLGETEFSGLAWMGDTLVLLPQYPSRFVLGPEGEGPRGVVFGIERRAIEAFVDGAGAQPESLSLTPIRFDDDGLERRIPGFQGYEAIAFDRRRVFALIECQRDDGMFGVLVSGKLLSEPLRIRLDASTCTEFPAQSPLPNMGYEAMLRWRDTTYCFYEANGRGVNPQPYAVRVSGSPNAVFKAKMPWLEYRMTDTTAPDSSGCFWAMNVFWPGERELHARFDPLRTPSSGDCRQSSVEHVERVVRMHMVPGGFELCPRPPLTWRLGAYMRNWEGLAELRGRGLLLVTDQWPTTMLGFVRASQGELSCQRADRP